MTQSKVKTSKTFSGPLGKILWKLTTSSKKPAIFFFQVSLIALIVIGFGSRVIEQTASELSPPKNKGSKETQQAVNQNPSEIRGPATALQPLPTQPTSAPVIPILSSKPSKPQKMAEVRGLPVYNINQAPNTRDSKELQQVVAEVIGEVQRQGLPTESLSISLINVASNQSASYQQNTLRFPASVAKMFWMVELYGWISKGLAREDVGVYDLSACKSYDICHMIQDSDNEAASRIVDILSSTASSHEQLGDADYQEWLQRRESMNTFFSQSSFEGINISQKNFPIPYLKLERPTGPDLKMRGSTESPYRNRISTAQAAQLMYDIVQGRAVSPDKSQQMMRLLTRYDLATGAWKGKQYNAIEGFFGENLPPNTQFASKVGWTSDSRQEVAYIGSPDGKSGYVLAIFADHPAYSKDWKIFPKVSRMVFDRMSNIAAR